MTDYKSTLKSNIQSVELKDKKVKITCANKNAGNQVITTLSQHVSIFGSDDYKINKGIDGAKDFNVKFDGNNKKSKAKAEVFYNNVIKIINDPIVPIVEAEKSNWEKTKEKAGESLKNAGATVKQALGIQETPTSTTVPSADQISTAVPAAAGGSDDAVGGGGNKTTIIIAAAAAVVLLLVVVLVMKRKRK